MKIAPFKAIYPNLNLVPSADSFFGTVKAKFPEYVKSGFFKYEENPAYFVYSIDNGKRIINGVIAATDIADFDEGKVLKHENTIAAKEQKMMNIVLQNNAMVKPVLIAYDKVKSVDKFIANVVKNVTPFFSVRFDDSNEVHTLYEIANEKQMKELEKLFSEDIKVSYIADGHHRVKTCQILRDSQKSDRAGTVGWVGNVLSMYLSWDQLAIYDYNRSVDAFINYSPIKFMARLSELCKMKFLKEGRKPKVKHEMTMFLYGEWYSLKWRKSVINRFRDQEVLFDTFLLDECVFGDILGIENVREDPRLRYIDGVAGERGLEELVNENKNRVGFCMYPVLSEDIKYVADEGMNLPPKSTWFVPRVKNGVIVQGF